MKALKDVPLGELAVVRNGKTPAREDQRNTGHPVLKIRDTNQHGRFSGRFESFVDTTFAQDHVDRCVAYGDILILNAAHNASHVASKIYRAEPVVSGALATGEWLIIRPNAAVLESSFLGHWIKSDSTRHLLRLMVKGIHLYPKDVARLQISLPPLTEQRRIAAILDQADLLRATRQLALAQTESLEQAIFEQQFLTSDTWPELPIGDLARSMRTGPFGSQLLHSEFVGEGIAVLGIDNAVTNKFAWGQLRFITETKYQTLARFRVYPRDVIVTIMGTCGQAAVVPDDIPLAITTKHLCSITLDEALCLPEYLHACLLRHPAVLRHFGITARGAVMPGLNMGLIKETKIPLPPLSIQRAFVKRQRELHDNRSRFEKANELSDALYASLQHRAFRGEL